MITETANRRRQRLWFNNYIESLAAQVKNLALNHPGDGARIALNAAAELLRREKKYSPSEIAHQSAAELRATAEQTRRGRASHDALFDGSNAHLLNDVGTGFKEMS